MSKRNFSDINYDQKLFQRLNDVNRETTSPQQRPRLVAPSNPVVLNDHVVTSPAGHSSPPRSINTPAVSRSVSKPSVMHEDIICIDTSIVDSEDSVIKSSGIMSEALCEVTQVSSSVSLVPLKENQMQELVFLKARSLLESRASRLSYLRSRVDDVPFYSEEYKLNNREREISKEMELIEREAKFVNSRLKDWEKVLKRIEKDVPEAKSQILSIIARLKCEYSLALESKNFLKAEQNEIASMQSQLLKEKGELRRLVSFLEMERHSVVFKSYPDRFVQNPDDPSSCFYLVSLLGKGAQAEVWRCINRNTSEVVALKFCKIPVNTDRTYQVKYIERVQREMRILESLRSPFICKQKEVFALTPDTQVMVLEYCDSSLEDEIRTGKMSPTRVLSVLKQLLCALAICSGSPPCLSQDPKEFFSTSTVGTVSGGNGGGTSDQQLEALRRWSSDRVIHRDIKPSNVLLKNSVVKLADFGLSKLYDHKEGDHILNTSVDAGTYFYSPPESFLEGIFDKISQKTDVWALGVMAYQMLHEKNKLPFFSDMSQSSIPPLVRQNQHNLARLFEVDYSSLNATPELKTFIEKCLTVNEAERPTVHELLDFLTTSKQKK